MQTLLSFIVVIGILVVVHEFGHFLAARSCGVKVLRFSVGFGRVLWQRRLGRDGTEWAISLVPLGGYVKMLDEREGPVADSDLPRAFNRQRLAVRSWIVVAGPLANFLFAIAAYWLVFMVGTMELRPLLGDAPAGTAAHAAGIGAGERVLRIDGEAVETWQALRWALVLRAAENEQTRLETIDGQGKIHERTLRLRDEGSPPLGERFIEELGLRIFRPTIPPLIGKVLPGSPAEAAGLADGDLIVAIDGKPIDNWQQLVEEIQASMGRSLAIEFERDGAILERRLTPTIDAGAEKPVARIGVQVAKPADGSHADIWIEVRHPPFEALVLAVRETWEKSAFTLQMFGKMLTGEVSWRNLSGPVTIADYAGQSAQLGFSHFTQFLALVSISLGVLNLLPIPLLDGGHLMYHAYEAVRRAPPSDRVMEYGQRLGLALLVMLMVFAFYNDIHRLVSG
jgi:regulator of sigma E protease